MRTNNKNTSILSFFAYLLFIFSIVSCGDKTNDVSKDVLAYFQPGGYEESYEYQCGCENKMSSTTVKNDNDKENNGKNKSEESNSYIVKNIPEIKKLCSEIHANAKPANCKPYDSRFKYSFEDLKEKNAQNDPNSPLECTCGYADKPLPNMLVRVWDKVTGSGENPVVEADNYKLANEMCKNSLAEKKDIENKEVQKYIAKNCVNLAVEVKK